MNKAKPTGLSLGGLVCCVYATYSCVCPPLRQVREDGKDKNSVVSFNLTDEPHHIDLFTSNSKEEVRWLCFTGGYLE